MRESQRRHNTKASQVSQRTAKLTMTELPHER